MNLDSIFQGPQLLHPNAPGQLAHKAVDAAFPGSSASAKDRYLTEDGSEITAVYTANNSAVEVVAH